MEPPTTQVRQENLKRERTGEEKVQEDEHRQGGYGGTGSHGSEETGTTSYLAGTPRDIEIH